MLSVGEVGLWSPFPGLKDPEAVRVGDIADPNPLAELLPGYHEAKTTVFTGLFPSDNKQYGISVTILHKLHVNDPFFYGSVRSLLLGFGFRVVFGSSTWRLFQRTSWSEST